jgi:hypothetical protein
MMNRILALPVPIAGILASFALPPIHFLPLLVALSYPYCPHAFMPEYAFSVLGRLGMWARLVSGVIILDQ